MRRILLGFTMLTLLTGCASMLPTQTVDGIAVYVRDGDTVDTYCRYRVHAAERVAPHFYGCYVAAENTIMVEAGHSAVLAHELKHAQGWKHDGPCHSTEAYPDGLTLAGTPCQWYR